MKNLMLFCAVVSGLFFTITSCKQTDKQNKKPVITSPMLLSNSQNKASCVFLTSGTNGTPLVSWIEKDSSKKIHFYFAKMDTTQHTFSAPLSIPIEQKAMTMEEMMPKIAVKGDGTLIAIYGTSTPYKDLKWGLGDIHYIQSFDNGKSWTTPQSVYPASVKKGLSINYTGFTSLGDGEVGITWLGTNPTDSIIARPVFFAKTHGHKGFEKPILINKRACECCRTAVSSDKKGNVSIAFRDILPGSIRDISVSFSHDYGKSFSPAVSFSNDHWEVHGCPHDGPSIAVRNGHTYATWFTGKNKEKGVYYAALDSSGKLISKKQVGPNGRFIQLCVQPNGTRIAAYNENIQAKDSIYSRIMLYKNNGKGGFKREITPHHSQATDPVIRSINNQQVVVAWKNRKKIYYKIVADHDITHPASENTAPENIPESGITAANLHSKSNHPVP